MASMRRFLSFFPLLILLSASACTCLPYLELPNVNCGRRPQVFCDINETPEDYNPVLECYSALLDEAEQCGEEGKERVPLAPSDFHPFMPTEDMIILSLGDVLEISIFDDDETYAKHVSVAPDGNIYYSIFKGIPAAGRSIPQVREDIQNAAKEYYLNPIATVTPIVVYNQTFKIFGKVRKPGIFLMKAPMTLREAIGVAEGFVLEDFEEKERDSDMTDPYNLYNSILVRNGRKLDVDFDALIKDPTSHQDIYVHPGDYIFIATEELREVYVLGNVAHPNRLQFTDGLTLTRALASVGGWPTLTPYSADITNVLVIRGCLDCPLAVDVNVLDILHGDALDVRLEPGDIIFVMNKTMRFDRLLIRLAIDAFFQSFGNAAGSYYANSVWFKISGGSDGD